MKSVTEVTGLRTVVNKVIRYIIIDYHQHSGKIIQVRIYTKLVLMVLEQVYMLTAGSNEELHEKMEELSKYVNVDEILIL